MPTTILRPKSVGNWLAPPPPLALQAIENTVIPSPAVTRKAKVGHNDGTHSQSDPMPRHLFKRDGRYYYRKRVPTEIADACGKKHMDLKKSLKTSDLATAKRIAQTVAIEVDAEIEAMRKKLISQGKLGLASQFAKSANDDSPAKRKLAGLSDVERRDFIIRAFIAHEKRDSERRSSNSDAVTRREKLDEARVDLAALEGSPNYQEIDWLAMTRKALEAEGICADGADDAKLRALAELMQRAIVESAWRTEQTLEGIRFPKIDPIFSKFHSESPMPMPAESSKTIGDLRREFLDGAGERAKAGNVAPSTIKWMEQSAKVMADFYGEGTALSTITKKDAARLVAFLQTLPKNAAKRYKGVSLIVAAEREGKLDAKQVIQPKTVGHYFEGVSSIFKRAVEWDWLRENPFVSRSVRERIPKVLLRHRQTMTPDEMTTAFSSPNFLAQRMGTEGAQEARFWLPLLCLFHGPRADEVAGMLVSDVRESNGVAFLNLRESEVHRLKTEASAREVPLHRIIEDLGFLEFVSKRRDNDPTGYLFTGLKQNKNGKRADAVCKWWARQIIKIFGPAPDDGPTGARGIHSLRHSWVAAARVAEIQEDIWERITGHSSGKKVSRTYGRHNELAMLKTAIDKIEFPKVDFSALFPPQADQ